MRADAAPRWARKSAASPEILRIEGYASLFGVPDQIGDVVRAGAFRASLRAGSRPPMLLRHDDKLPAGRWSAAFEDSRGLFVSGEIALDAAAGALARRLIGLGLDGLSIGFRTRMFRARPAGGRELIALDLIEVSLVEAPMLATARFRVVA